MTTVIKMSLIHLYLKDKGLLFEEDSLRVYTNEGFSDLHLVLNHIA